MSLCNFIDNVCATCGYRFRGSGPCVRQCSGVMQPDTQRQFGEPILNFVLANPGSTVDEIADGCGWTCAARKAKAKWWAEGLVVSGKLAVADGRYWPVG